MKATLDLRPLEGVLAPLRKRWDWDYMAWARKNHINKKEAIELIEKLDWSAIGARLDGDTKWADFYDALADVLVFHFRKIWKTPYN